MDDSCNRKLRIHLLHPSLYIHLPESKLPYQSQIHSNPSSVSQDSRIFYSSCLGDTIESQASDRKMKNSVQEQVFAIPINSGSYQVVRSPRVRGYLPGSDGQYSLSFPVNGSSTCKKRKVYSVLRTMNKLGKKADTFAAGIREHVRLGPKITETVKGKLSLGAKILQVGGMGRIFRRLFNVSEGEKLLKVSQCYLSTTTGPIAGLLFISTDKIAFCSERSMEFYSPEGESVRFHYKVLIPIVKVKGINQSENVKNPSQKYIDIVTVDNFDFWFMGFLNYKKTFKNLQLAVFGTLDDDKRVTCQLT